MSTRNPYKSFPNYVLRTPLFSFNFYKELTSKKNITNDEFKRVCHNPIVKESLFLASPSLYQEINRWLQDEITDEKKIERLRFSILKYLSRMSSRCTPFGLFAGCSVGSLSNETVIELKGTAKNKRHTRLDMNYLVALSQDLVKNQKIKEQLLFFPNSSIYRIGDQIRYVEYNYIKSNRRHHIVAVDDSEYLSKILDLSWQGAKLSDLSTSLIDDEITLEEAADFIEDLVSNQLLISELEPSVSGPEFLDQINTVLKKLNDVEELSGFLDAINQKTSIIDKTIGNDPQLYYDLSQFLEKLNTEFELKYLFQTDMILNPKINILDSNLIDAIKKGLTLLNKITLPPPNSSLTKFKDAFYERFEDRELPLSKALDVEVGLGYKQDIGSGDVNPLVDNIMIPRQQSSEAVGEIKWSSINSLFQRKLIEALKKGSYTIQINDEDFQNYDCNWEDLPDTISCMVEIIKENGEQKIKFQGGGGSSAANLLGRFCHCDKELYTYTQEITALEAELQKDKILAEIVHLPESRVGNILMRPDLRSYEIPYLAKSVKSKEKQLPLDDLTISIKNYKKVLLKSKKHNKEVIPHLTNAHNYTNNALPIYQFLGDLQTQQKRSGIGFNFGPFMNDYEFLPRVEYLNLIIHNATWNLSKKHMKTLLDTKDDDTQLEKTIISFRDSLNIPQFITLVDGDNELLVNFENLTSVRMFLNTIHKRSHFKIREFLFGEDGFVTQGKDYYTNQIIVSFYNDEKLTRTRGDDHK